MNVEEKNNHLENQDIGKIKGMNNKEGNIIYLTRRDVFKRLMIKFNAITDNSFAYIPTREDFTYYEDKNNKIHFHHYFNNDSTNNYADLMIGFADSNDEQIALKVSRVKSLHCINMDGRHLCFDSNDREYLNHFVFYCVNADEQNYMLIMNEHAYRMIFENNANMHCKYFDITEINDLYKMGLSVNDIQLFDLNEKLELEKETNKNLTIKRNYLVDNLMYLLKTDKNKSILHKKTHYGHEYMAVNIFTKQVVHFRDAHSRDNFILKNKITDKISDEYIRLGCKNMNDIVKGIKTDKNRINLYDNGWIIMFYKEDLNIESFITNLFTKLCEKSTYWKHKIEKLLATVGKTIQQLFERFTDKITKRCESAKKALKIWKPYKLWSFVTSNESELFNSFIQNNPFFKYKLRVERTSV